MFLLTTRPRILTIKKICLLFTFSSRISLVRQAKISEDDPGRGKIEKENVHAKAKKHGPRQAFLRRILPSQDYCH